MNNDVRRITGIITNQLDSGSAFALADDTDEQVFIRSIIAKRVALEVGDEVEMVVVPNANNNNGSCPWFALRVIILDDDYNDEEESEADGDDAEIERLREETHEFIAKIHETRAEPQRKWAEEAYMFLDVNGPATTSQIAKAVGYSTHNIRTYLYKMHDRGEIVRADIRTSSKQSKASATVWALELYDLLPEENEL